jgi:hypothetical protein
MVSNTTELNIREVMIENFYPEGILPPEVKFSFKVDTVDDCEGLTYWRTTEETFMCEIDPLILEDVQKAFSEESSVPIRYTGAVAEIIDEGVYKLLLVRIGFQY